MTQTTDELVNREVAQLLMENGFDEPCKLAWTKTSKKPIQIKHLSRFSNNKHNQEISVMRPIIVATSEDPDFTYMMAPTQQRAIRWLRENKDTIVDPHIHSFVEETWKYNIYYSLTKTLYRCPKVFKNFEEMVNIALVEALKHMRDHQPLTAPAELFDEKS